MMTPKYIKSMLEYQADLIVLVMKLFNLHWNVVGRNFLQIHKFTEELYERFLEQIDEVGEMLKARKEYPIKSLKEALELTKLDELDMQDYTEREAMEILERDFRELSGLILDVRAEAEKEKDFEVVAKFDEYYSVISKYTWFVKAMLRD